MGKNSVNLRLRDIEIKKSKQIYYSRITKNWLT